jgi:hypothetical protein
MDKKTETRYITHLVVDKIPECGFSELSFYTSTAEGYNQGRYFWETDNNVLDETYIKHLEDLEKIIRLPILKELEGEKRLWVDKDGRVYYAGPGGPFQGKEYLFAPKQLSRIYQIYQESIESNNLPKINQFIEIC